MVFEKLTLFEFHVEDAQFGPRSLPGPASEETAEEAAGAAAADESGERQADDAGRGPGARRLLALAGAGVVLSVAAALVARRLAGSDRQATVEEFAGEDDGRVEIETGEFAG